MPPVSNDVYMPWVRVDQPRVPNRPFHSDSLDAQAKGEFFRTDLLISWKSVIFIAAAFAAFMVLLYFVG